MKIEEFKRVVERHWKHHAPSEHLLWNVKIGDDRVQVEVAPVYQEIVGGQQDGEMVWAGFRFDLSEFLAERGLLVESIQAASYCTQCVETPFIGVRGSFYAKAFDLRIYLEPVPGSAPVEVIDTLAGTVRAIGEN